MLVKGEKEAIAAVERMLRRSYVRADCDICNNRNDDSEDHNNGFFEIFVG